MIKRLNELKINTNSILYITSFSIMESTPTWLLQSNIYITIDMIYEDIIGKHKSIRNYLASDF